MWLAVRRARGEADGEAGGAPGFAHALARRLTALLPLHRMPGKIGDFWMHFEMSHSEVVVSCFDAEFLRPGHCIGVGRGDGFDFCRWFMLLGSLRE